MSNWALGQVPVRIIDPADPAAQSPAHGEGRRRLWVRVSRYREPPKRSPTNHITPAPRLRARL